MVLGVSAQEREREDAADHMRRRILWSDTKKKQHKGYVQQHHQTPQSQMTIHMLTFDQEEAGDERQSQTHIESVDSRDDSETQEIKDITEVLMAKQLIGSVEHHHEEHDGKMGTGRKPTLKKKRKRKLTSKTTKTKKISKASKKHGGNRYERDYYSLSTSMSMRPTAQPCRCTVQVYNMAPSPTSSSGGLVSTDLLEVTIQYGFSNNCGLDADDVMNGNDNTLKEGLISATTTVLVDTLNATYPREEQSVRERDMKADSDMNKRALVYVDSSKTGLAAKRVFYTPDHPVRIDSILDNPGPSCPDVSNCLLIISSITVVLEEGDDEIEVEDAILDGFTASFLDGRFFDAIPEDTIICP